MSYVNPWFSFLLLRSSRHSRGGRGRKRRFVLVLSFENHLFLLLLPTTFQDNVFHVNLTEEEASYEKKPQKQGNRSQDVRYVEVQLLRVAVLLQVKVSYSVENYVNTTAAYILGRCDSFQPDQRITARRTNKLPPDTKFLPDDESQLSLPTGLLRHFGRTFEVKSVNQVL